jgi:hypothetical protein
LGLTPLALAVALGLKASIRTILEECSTATVTTAAAGGTTNPDTFAPDVSTGTMVSVVSRVFSHAAMVSVMTFAADDRTAPLDLARVVLTQQALVNHVCPCGVTIGMLAAKHNDRSLMESLVAAGASLEGCDDDGNDALMWAVRHGNRGIVQFLLSNGFNPNFPPAGSTLPAALPTIGGAGSLSEPTSAKPWLPPLHVAAVAGDLQVRV